MSIADAWRLTAMRAGVLIAFGWIAASEATAAGPAGSAVQQVSVDAVVRRAGDYVTRFADAFSNVVAEERYAQNVSGATSGMIGKGGHRELRSDVLLLKIGGPLEWRPYRDVFEVDNKPVRDRDDRLITLFQQPSATSLEQAARIARESARYNIGLTRRTINTPLLSLLFLQPSIQPRFRFRLGRNDAAVGPRVWIVEYREEKRPTLIRGLSTDEDTDLPASGRFWIDVDTGRVAKAELLFAAFGLRANLVTSFRHDDRLDMDVPFDMREEYRLENRVTQMGPIRKDVGAPEVRYSTEETLVTGTATYSNFRRFEVSTGTTTAPVRP